MIRISLDRQQVRDTLAPASPASTAPGAGEGGLTAEQVARLQSTVTPCCELDTDGDGDCPRHHRYTERAPADAGGEDADNLGEIVGLLTNLCELMAEQSADLNSQSHVTRARDWLTGYVARLRAAPAGGKAGEVARGEWAVLTAAANALQYPQLDRMPLWQRDELAREVRALAARAREGEAWREEREAYIVALDQERTEQHRAVARWQQAERHVAELQAKAQQAANLVHNRTEQRDDARREAAALREDAEKWRAHIATTQAALARVDALVDTARAASHEEVGNAD